MIDLDALHRVLSRHSKNDLIELACNVAASDFTSRNALACILDHKPRRIVLTITLLLCLVDHLLTFDNGSH